MPDCKNCKSKTIVKNGTARGKQRYKCKSCGCSFRPGDARTNEGTAAKKAMCILLCSMAKGSFRMLGRMFDRSHSLIYRRSANSARACRSRRSPAWSRRWSST